MGKTNILFVHPLVGNAYELYKSFQRNDNVNIIPLLTEKRNKDCNVFFKIMSQLKCPIDSYGINRKLQKYDMTSIGIVLIVKGNEVYPKTLRKIQSQNPHLKLINWSLDDMYLWHNRSIYYKYAIKYYDFVVTTKSCNIYDLPMIGAKKILFTHQAYSKDIHQPKKCSGKYNHSIVFIGYPEKERIESILFLANHGFKIDIYGAPHAWNMSKNNVEHENIVIHREVLLGDDYAEALSCAKISLCFLRKKNRDLHTSRSIEVPACGGFMLAERTDEHLDLFEEDKEAAYFENNEELLRKVQYYLKHESERKKIVYGGYTRCIESDYSYDDMVQRILNGLSL